MSCSMEVTAAMVGELAACDLVAYDRLAPTAHCCDEKFASLEGGPIYLFLVSQES